VSEPLVIVGSGGHGREVWDVVEACGGYELLGFVDDSGDAPGVRDDGVHLLGPIAHLATLGPVKVVVGIGDPRPRATVVKRLREYGDVSPAEALVHPLASVGSRCTIGAGTVVAAGARITTNVRIGNHCYIGPNASVGHDAVLLDGATLYPGSVVSGSVSVGEAATIGAGATIRQGLRIGASAFVALGAGVVRDVPEGTTVAGTPARRLGSR
jgi:sugar O-acyltransferase (sialic acid O-acetyltransferase NeuD family)